MSEKKNTKIVKIEFFADIRLFKTIEIELEDDEIEDLLEKPEDYGEMLVESMVHDFIRNGDYEDPEIMLDSIKIGKKELLRNE